MRSTAVKFEESKQTYVGEDSKREVENENGGMGWGVGVGGKVGNGGGGEGGQQHTEPPTKEGPRSKYGSTGLKHPFNCVDHTRANPKMI